VAVSACDTITGASLGVDGADHMVHTSVRLAVDFVRYIKDISQFITILFDFFFQILKFELNFNRYF
jgi:hypothetical protein